MSWAGARTLATFLTASLLNRGGANRPKFWGTSFCTRPNDRAPYLSAHQQGVLFSYVSTSTGCFVQLCHTSTGCFFQLCQPINTVFLKKLCQHINRVGFSQLCQHINRFFSLSNYVSTSTGCFFQLCQHINRVFFPSYVSISTGVFSVMSAH